MQIIGKIDTMTFLSSDAVLISMNLQYDLAWKTAVMSGKVLLAATWIC